MGEHRRQPKHAEIYFYSGEEDQLACRLNNFEQLDTPLLRRDAMETIQAVLHRLNPFVHLYRTGLERYRLNQEAARTAGRDPDAENRRIVFRTTGTQDSRRYNASTAPMEVAAILPATNEWTSGSRDIIVQDSGGGLRRCFVTRPATEPMSYPLLNPTGVMGYSDGISLHRQSRGEVDDERGLHSGSRGGGASGGARSMVSQREFYTYRTVDRSRQRGSTVGDPDLPLDSILHRGGRLYQ